ncbi:hypothetical protein [Actinoplanes sp. RD1]|uniref:hypothetical protein n=1 Tax=Actinoplanes sp. RD1 TaxID=3064538 RepID=UPI0027426606|nr:hypothetical protein [Actinoplanes sp. RD1]
MSNSFLNAPRRGRRLAVTAAGAALVAGVAVATVVAGQHDDAPAPAAPGEPAISAQAPLAVAPVPVASASSPATVPVTLVAGARRVNDVEVGFPHNAAGAVSAAVEYATQLGSTLDPQRASDIGEAIGDRNSGMLPAVFAQGPLNSRHKLGLPETGLLPTGASMTLGPVSYQLRDQGKDRVTVLLLGYITTITPAQGLKNAVGVFPAPLVWSDGDWKLVRRAPDAPDYAELRFAPGSTEAVAAGWLPLVA